MTVATSADQRVLAKLRAVAELLARAHPTGHASPSSPAGSYSGAFLRSAARAIVAIATLEVAAALLLLPWGWNAFHRLRVGVCRNSLAR